MIDVTDFIARAEGLVAGARIAPGVYARHSGRAEAEADPYGCADAANILYTIGRFPRDHDTRRAFVAGLNDLQDADGMWREDTHHEIHTTAHCLAALELFDAGPAREPAALAELTDPDRMERFLADLKWRTEPWRASHMGAGLHATLVLSGAASKAWRERYVAWLAENADRRTGLWRADHVAPIDHVGAATLFPHLAGTFHYLFALESERAPLPFPGALIDTCLDIYANDPFPLGRTIGFAEIDWVYCLSRAGRQTAHRFDERVAALRAFAVSYCRFLGQLDGEQRERARDLHFLFGAVCALAELQGALPGLIRTERPLRLVLDRRPFI